MKVFDSEKYQEWKDKQNGDPYGLAIFDYAETWADLMEKDMEKGAKLTDIAKQLSSEADTSGITGFMYGAAVSVLSSQWVHGEELRDWHNAQYGHTGSGVVNPAIITVSKGE